LLAQLGAYDGVDRHIRLTVLGGVPSDAVLGVDESHSRCSTTAPAAPGRRCAAHGPVAGLAGSGGGRVTKTEGKEGLVERRACSGRRLRVNKGEKQTLSWFTRYGSQLVGVCCNLQLIQQDTRYTSILYNRTNKLQLNQVHVQNTIHIFIASNTPPQSQPC
jgi:hypothetical protein